MKIWCRSLTARVARSDRSRWMTSSTCVSSSAIGRQVMMPRCSSGSPMTLKSGSTVTPSPSATISLPISAPSVE